MVPATPTRRFRPRFRLRTFLVLLTIFCVWLGWHVHGVRRQREAVAAIREYGGFCYYDYQCKEGKPDHDSESWAPKLALELLGDDFFHSIVQVGFDYNARLRSGRDMHSLPTAEIGKLSKATVLFLEDYAIDDDDLRHLGRLTQLEVLAMEHGIGVTDEGVAHLSRLGKLKVLYIHNSETSDPALKCQLGDRSLEVFSRLPQLSTLRVWGTFTDEGVSHLSRLENLRELSLAHGNRQHQNEITDQSLAFLLELPDFERLDLSQTKVTPEFVEQVKTTFPECDVSW